MPVYLRNENFERDIIFIHIPRTGGTHIQSVLRRTFDPMPLTIRRSIQPCTFGHYTYDNVLQTLEENGCSTAGSDYFCFSFVRNPFDTIVSSYLNYTIKNTPNFEDYVKLVEHMVLNESYRDRAEIRTNDLSHCIPQTVMIGGAGLDYIGRFERSEEDLVTLGQLTKIDVGNDIRLKKRGLDYRELYNRATRNIIETVYREDLERFEYSFD